MVLAQRRPGDLHGLAIERFCLVITTGGAKQPGEVVEVGGIVGVVLAQRRPGDLHGLAIVRFCLVITTGGAKQRRVVIQGFAKCMLIFAISGQFQRGFAKTKGSGIIAGPVGKFARLEQVVQCRFMARRAGVVGRGVGPADLGLGNLAPGKGGAGGGLDGDCSAGFDFSKQVIGGGIVAGFQCGASGVEFVGVEVVALACQAGLEIGDAGTFGFKRLVDVGLLTCQFIKLGLQDCAIFGVGMFQSSANPSFAGNQSCIKLVQC